jgi:hypothetical protein
MDKSTLVEASIGEEHRTKIGVFERSTRDSISWEMTELGSECAFLSEEEPSRILQAANATVDKPATMANIDSLPMEHSLLCH